MTVVDDLLRKSEKAFQVADVFGGTGAIRFGERYPYLIVPGRDRNLYMVVACAYVIGDRTRSLGLTEDVASAIRAPLVKSITQYHPDSSTAYLDLAAFINSEVAVARGNHLTYSATLFETSLGFWIISNYLGISVSPQDYMEEQRLMGGMVNSLSTYWNNPDI